MIIKDHLRTLEDFEMKRFSWADFSLFFIIPLIISAILVRSNILIDNNIITVLATAISIFAGFLFNLLLIILDMNKKQDGVKRLKHRIPFLKQIYKNISFNILVSISAVTMLILLSLFSCKSANQTILESDIIIPILIQFGQLLSLLTFIAYYLIFLFLLTLLMILKRIYILVGKEIEINEY